MYAMLVVAGPDYPPRRTVRSGWMDGFKVR